MKNTPNPSREEGKHEKQPPSLNAVPIPRENKIWLGIIAIILIVGFIALFIII